MKSLPFVPPVALTSPDGAAIVDLRGEQQKLTHLDFLFSRVADQRFVEGLDGGAAIELVVDARKALRSQAGTAEARGYWLLEEEHARRLADATLRPASGYQGAVMHNLHAFVVAAKAMVDAPAQQAAE